MYCHRPWIFVRCNVESLTYFHFTLILIIKGCKHAWTPLKSYQIFLSNFLCKLWWSVIQCNVMKSVIQSNIMMFAPKCWHLEKSCALSVYRAVNFNKDFITLVKLRINHSNPFTAMHQWSTYRSRLQPEDRHTETITLAKHSQQRFIL